MTINLTYNDSNTLGWKSDGNFKSWISSEIRTLMDRLRLYFSVSHFDAKQYGCVDANRKEQIFNEISKNYGNMISRICFGYSRTPDELADLRQDSMLNIWQGLEKYRGESSLKTWVYRVTLNTCVSTLRNRHKELKGITVDEIYDMIDDSEERRIELKELHETILLLNPIDRAIVMLWLDEFSYEEIAGTTGISRANVATRLHRAKLLLKNKFKE